VAWSPCAAYGPVVANRQQGAVGGLAGAPGRTPGKEEGAGVHPKGGSTARRHERRRVGGSSSGR
jgi:hypothetical protein